MAKKRGGFPGGFGGGNINQLMKQAQKMQADLAKAQEEIADLVVEHTAGGGMVTVKMNGEHELLELNIDPDALDPEDVDILQDTIIAAINGANKKLAEESDNKMGGLTSGLPGGLGGLGF